MRLAAAAIAVLVALRAALPLGLEVWIEREAQTTLGRAVELQDVDLGLLTGDLVIEGLTVGEPLADRETQGSAPRAALLTLERGALQLDWRALAAKRIHLRRVELGAPRLRLERDEEGALSPIVTAPPPPDPEPEPAEAGAAWPLVIDVVALRDAEIDLVPRVGDESALLALRLAQLDVSDVSLDDDGLALGDVALVEPQLQVRRELVFGGEVSAEAAGERPPGVAEGPAAEPAGVATPPAGGYRVRSLAVERARFDLVSQDASLGVAFALSARDVSLAAGARFPVELHLEIHEGTIDASGELGLSPPSYAGSLRWSGLGFPLLLPVLVPELPLQVDSVVSSGDVTLEVLLPGPAGPGSARVSGRGATDNVALQVKGSGSRIVAKRIELEADSLFVPLAAAGADGGPVRFVGRLGARELDLKSADGGLAATLDGLEIGARDVSFDPSGDSPARVRLSSVRLENPKLAVVRAAPSDVKPDDESSGPAALDLAVAELAVQDGSFEFTDETRTPSFRSGLRELALSARDLRWPAQTAERVSLRGKGPAGSSVELQGTLGAREGSVELALRSLALPPFNPYVESAGYRLKSGSGSLEGMLRRAGDEVGMDADLVLDDFDVAALDADNFNERFGISLDLALALVRDATGRIELPVQFETRRGELRTELTPILVATLRQALLGAATIPLKTLQGAAQIVTGNGRIGVTPLVLEPGVASLPETTEAVAGIEALAQLLAARPSLGVVLHGRVGPADEPALAARSLAEQLRAGGDLPALSDVSSRTRRRIAEALRAHGAATAAALGPDDVAVLARYLATTPVSDEQRRELAGARAQAVQGLLEGLRVDAARVRAGEPTTGEPGVVPELVPAEGLRR